MEFIAFMCYTTIEHYDYLEETLKEYNIGTYFIGYEGEPYEHYHFLVEMPPEDYVKFRKRVFIDKLKLRGQAKSGQPRQYGKINNIKDIEKMKSYTIKEGNYRTNLEDQQELQILIDRSFSKQEKIDKEKQILALLQVRTTEEMRRDCIQLCAEVGQNPRPTRSRVDQLIVMKLVEKKRWERIYEILYNREITY